MHEAPQLDPEAHEDDTTVSVWKRRLVLFLLICLVAAVAAPSFSGCGHFLDSKTTVATFEVAGRTHDVTQEDVERFVHRYVSTMYAIGRRPDLPEGDEGTKTVLRMMMLDAAAREEGIHVPDARIAEFLEPVPQFQVAGKFDEAQYRRVLADPRFGITHEQLAETLRTLLRIGEYQQIYGALFDVIPGDEAYDQWKKRNVKLTVEYVPSPYEFQREKIAAVVPTDDDLRSVADLPEVRSLLAVPPRKTVEVAYLKVADFTADQVAAARTYVKEADVLPDDDAIGASAFVLFHSRRDSVFTKKRWGQMKDPDYATKYDAWKKEHAEWDKLPKEGRPAEPAEPKDPSADYPEESEERAQFPLWREYAEKEVLTGEIVKALGQRAEREGKSLAEVAPEFAKFGVKVVRNTEPLSDTEIIQKFPDPIARDSEFDQVAITEFRPPAEGALFKRRYHSEPIPTTRVSDNFADRGSMVLALEGSDPARQYAVAEKRDVVTEFWRKHKVGENAKALAEEVRKKAEAAGADPEKAVEALRKAATEAGLTPQTLRRFNRTTEAPKPPVPAPGQKLSPELEAVARRLAYRNRVQQDYEILAQFEPGKFREPVLVDERIEAAIVELVVEKREPTPLEMQDSDLRQERMALGRQAMEKVNDLYGFDALAKRFKLQRFEDPARKAKPGR